MRPAGTIALFVRNPVMANLLTVTLLVGGLLSARLLVREVYPEFSLDHVAIEVAYPGASPEDVEEGITIKIEEAIAGLRGIEEVSSSSSEGGCAIFVKLGRGADEVGRVIQDIQDRINRITSFPDGAEDPVVAERVLRNRVINVAIAGDMPEFALKAIATKVRTDLLRDPDISQVSLIGVRDSEIAIEVSEEALQRYGLSIGEVTQAVARGTTDLPAGTLRTRNREITLRTIGDQQTAADFENIVIISAADGTRITLGQMAKVRDTFEASPKRGWFNGKPGVLVGVYKTPDQDTSRIARKVRAYVERERPAFPPGAELRVWADESRDVDARISMLLSNGMVGMALVFVMLMVFLNLRVSFWVALGIPVSFAGAIIFMGWFGLTLNMITLLGLIMASGIIVDDAIVIAEHIHSKRQQKKRMTGPDVAIEAAGEMALPVLGSSATTIIAFAPLMFVAGTMGRFIYDLPVVVIAAVVASSIEAFCVLPAHLRHVADLPESPLLGPRLSMWSRLRTGSESVLNHLSDGWYKPALRWVLARRMIVLSTSFALLLLTAGLAAGGHVPFMLMNRGESNLLRARVRFLNGTTSEQTELAARKIEAAAWSLNQAGNTSGAPDGVNAGPVRQVFSGVGEWSGFWTEKGPHLCEVQVELAPSESRGQSGAALVDAWRRAIGDVPDALSVTVEQLENLPAEEPIELRLHGNDLAMLREAADELRDRLADFSGTFDISDDLLPGTLEAQIRLKPIATTLGLSSADLAAQMRMAYFGGEAVRVLRDREEVKVNVRYAEENRRNLSEILSMKLRTPGGEEIPFREAAELRTTRPVANVWRQDGQRRVRVRADVNEQLANAEQIINELEATFIPEFVHRYRARTSDSEFSCTVAGQRAQMRESVDSLFQGFVMALVGIYAVLASSMRSYVQPLIIMLTIPLGMIGAVAGHMVMGYDLTLMSLFGVVILSGVVVNDALVLVVQTNRRIEEGESLLDAVVAGASSRWRAVLLTTLTTVAGLSPLLFERSTQARQLIPMVISLCFGLILATLLTLFVIPAMYIAVNDAKRFARWVWRGGPYPSAEAVPMIDGGRAQVG